MTSIFCDERCAAACVLTAAVLQLAACGGNGDAQTPLHGGAQAPLEACASLNGMAIAASEIGLPTTGAVVQSSTFVEATAANNSNGEFCQVKGIVKPVDPAAPNIEFQVNLPTAWNRKALPSRRSTRRLSEPDCNRVGWARLSGR